MMMIVLLGFGALAIDLGHQFVVRNELHNAADAGALAGALALFDAQGNINTGANSTARAAAVANLSDKQAVEVSLGNNDSDVQRGTWDFDTETFTQSNSTDPGAINAMMLRTHRSASQSWLARIFGYTSFSRSAESVAYIGYAGSEIDFDQPIAICKQRVTDPTTGEFSCTIGRMIHSGQSGSNQNSQETARWTNFSEECADPASTGSIKRMVCGGATTSGTGWVSTNNGEVQPAMDSLHNCWVTETDKSHPWYLILPVIDCPATESPTCSKIVGAVQVEVVWVTENGQDPDYNDIPEEMSLEPGQDGEGWPGDWYRSVECAGLDLGTVQGRKDCWEKFMADFNILDDQDQPYEKIPVSLYFRPSCDFDVEGSSGGDDFNVRASYPKLVK
jgi:Flp pilus assembly protein TadG